MAKILVVDDQEEIRTTIRSLLNDHDVSLATDGQQALDALDGDSFDLVILDINMPVMDGWETLRIIKDPDSGYATKVVVLTAENQPEDFMKSAIIGAEYFVGKPLSPVILLETVERALQDIKWYTADYG